MILSRLLTGFPGGSVVKNPPANVGASGDVSSVLESERSPGGGNGNPLQYSAWEIPWTEEKPQYTEEVLERYEKRGAKVTDKGWL